MNKKKKNGQCISYGMNRDNGLFGTKRVIIIDYDITTNLSYSSVSNVTILSPRPSYPIN